MVKKSVCQHNIAPISMKGIYFSRHRRPVLEALDLRVEQGEFLGLAGPNGAGKTTIFRILLGLLRPDAGRVLLFGREPRSLGREKKLVGYLPQKPLIDPNFPASVFDVVKMGRTASRGLLRFWQTEDDRAVEGTLARLGLKQLANRPVGELSGGQQQLVFLARALVNQPQLLLVDEPTTGLDLRAQGMFYPLMRELKEEYSLTVMAISHDVDRLARHADRMVYLNGSLGQETATARTPAGPVAFYQYSSNV